MLTSSLSLIALCHTSETSVSTSIHSTISPYHTNTPLRFRICFLNTQCILQSQRTLCTHCLHFTYTYIIIALSLRRTLILLRSLSCTAHIIIQCYHRGTSKQAQVGIFINYSSCGVWLRELRRSHDSRCIFASNRLAMMIGLGVVVR